METRRNAATPRGHTDLPVRAGFPANTLSGSAWPFNRALRSAMLAALFSLWPTATATAQVEDVDALVEAVTSGSPGDTVRVAAGTFRLTAPLVPKAKMTIQGAGAGKTIITAADSWNPGTKDLPKEENPAAYLFSFNKTADVTISDMTLRGPHLHGAIYCDNSDGLELSNLRVEKFLWSGIRTYRMDRFRVHDNVFVDAGGKIGHTGGALYMHYTKDSEFWNNRITKTDEHPTNFFGFKGRKGTRCRFHHNTVDVDFSLEFPFENDLEVEIDHNAFAGTISIPKYAGGVVVENGHSFHIHHNWIRKSYALEWARNSAEVDHNLFDISPEDEKGNLVTDHGRVKSPGPTHFHDNLIKNPGRGLFWSKTGYNNFRFYNNHVKANTPTRESGLFGFPPGTDFKTMVIRDNIIECAESNPRPLLRNEASQAAVIENNKLIHVSDAGSYANRQTGAPQGLTKPLRFECGVNGEFLVDGWEVSSAKAGPASATPGE